jgi:hypothetical protein
VVGLLIGALERLRTACAAGLQAIAVRVPSGAIKHRGQAWRAWVRGILGIAPVQTLGHGDKTLVQPQLAKGRAGGGMERPLATRLLLGMGLIGLLGFSCGVWAVTTPIAGAVIASGTVVVESNIKKVQHPSGGIVAEILVKNGDRVGRRRGAEAR